MQALNSRCMTLIMQSGSSFSALGWMPSGPGALNGPNDLSASPMLALVIAGWDSSVCAQIVCCWASSSLSSGGGIVQSGKCVSIRSSRVSCGVSVYVPFCLLRSPISFLLPLVSIALSLLISFMLSVSVQNFSHAFFLAYLISAL